ncbi:MAG: DMT family transporter [Planctomycetes bacterium]|nr:DMT family transporter [Planctomycetota bacterium]
MAKQVVNPIERHVEKAVLGVAGIALIAVIVMYAVRSPNQVEIGGEMVTPGEIDAKLAQQAVDVRDWISSHQPKEVPFEPLADQFATALEWFKRNNLPTELRAGVSIGPEVPFVDPKGAKPGQAQLVKVLTLGKPLVERYGAIESTFLVMGFGAVLYFPIGLPAAITADYSTVTLADVGMVLYLALVTSGLVYGLWYWLVGHMRPSQVAVIMCAQPPVTFYLAYLFQGEQLTPMLLIGSLVTLAGIALMIIGGGGQRNIDFQPARPPEPPAEENSR